jgi:hypothetical protein
VVEAEGDVPNPAEADFYPLDELLVDVDPVAQRVCFIRADRGAQDLESHPGLVVSSSSLHIVGLDWLGTARQKYLDERFIAVGREFLHLQVVVLGATPDLVTITHVGLTRRLVVQTVQMGAKPHRSRPNESAGHVKRGLGGRKNADNALTGPIWSERST